MNRFIANKNFYQRNGVSASFVVKKQFADEAAEALAVVRGKDESTLDTIHEDLRHQIMDCKDMTKTDTSTDFMDIFNRMPRFLGKVHRLASHETRCPRLDPRIDHRDRPLLLHGCHLEPWLDQAPQRLPSPDELGHVLGVLHHRRKVPAPGLPTRRLPMRCTRCWISGLTIDERLADGYYYSKTIRLLRTLLENPELLETPANQEIEY